MIFIAMGCWFLASLGLNAHPEAHPGLDQVKVELLGNASRERASIVLLPEVHDDAQVLSEQLQIIAQEKARGGRVIFLGESILAFSKSPWDLFSQKALNISCAQSLTGRYSPQSFERELYRRASALKNKGALSWIEEQNMWALPAYSRDPTSLYGWDLKAGSPLIERNEQLVLTLKKALETHDRVVVTLGARHVPELEYLSSIKLLCPRAPINSMEDYFSRIKKNHGPKPTLPRGVGSSLPVYDFLKTHNYAIVFGPRLYNRLDNAVTNSHKCLDLGE